MNSRQRTWSSLLGGGLGGAYRIVRSRSQSRATELVGVAAASRPLAPRLGLAGVVALLAAAPAAVGETSAGQESWERSQGKFARYGLITQTCLRAGHTDTCLGLACHAGRLQLVSAAGGGGPLDGPVTVGFGGQLLKVRFTEDPRAIEVMGISASRTTIEPEPLRTMATAPTIELHSGQGSTRLSIRFRTGGLRAEVRRAQNLCPARSLAPR
jgi:hypothetical protein